MESPTQLFLEGLRLSLASEPTKITTIWMAYVAYHIWLSRNSWVSQLKRVSVRFVLEHSLIQATDVTHLESANLTSRILDEEYFCSSYRVTLWMFISWELPSPIFLKVNFDGNVMGTTGGAGFIIRGLDSRLMTAGGSHLFGPSVLGAELWMAWAGTVYARLTHCANRLMIESDCTAIIGCIQSYARIIATHLWLQDIFFFTCEGLLRYSSSISIAKLTMLPIRSPPLEPNIQRKCFGLTWGPLLARLGIFCFLIFLVIFILDLYEYSIL